MKKNTKSKILVVDDSSVNNLLFQAILEENGHSVLLTFNGNEALKIAIKEEPDLILLDIMMPGMSGFEILEKIVSDDKLKHIPVIMVTAKIDNTDKKKALEMGAIDYIVKPVDIDNTLERVEHALKHL